mgnify:CR=1 FL=1
MCECTLYFAGRLLYDGERKNKNRNGDEHRVYKQLCKISGEENVLRDEPMKKHTTFRIGGPADYFVTVQSKDEIREILLLCKREQIPYYILGNGSNLLVGDKGYRGVVIQICKRMNEIRTEGNKIYAQAGALLSKIAAQALSNSLTGFEFASGIPGTLGGAVMMNAGAYGGEMKHVLESADVLTPEGEFLILSLEELELGYRTSVVATKGYTVLGATIALEKGNPEEIKAYMDDLAGRRKSRQPLEFPSAGSTFKRPAGNFAGKLIEEAGLAGYRVGGAEVSGKHCGFVINRDHATASDIMTLCQDVKRRVKEHSGVELEMEVKTLGRF